MSETYDTGLELLVEAAAALDMASAACESPEDASRFTALAGRVRRYLEVSRPTTTLGMPRIPSSANKMDEGAINRTAANRQTHIRVLPR